MKIEIKPFIHQVSFAPQLIWRPVPAKLRLSKPCRHAWLTERGRGTNRRPAETTNFF